jgi:hypothetical protein
MNDNVFMLLLPFAFLILLRVWIWLCGFMVALVDHKCGGTYWERYYRFVITAREMFKGKR